MEKRKILKNVVLKGIISKKRAVELLGMETEKTVTVTVKGCKIKIEIYRDDNDDTIIDYINFYGEPAGGLFE